MSEMEMTTPSSVLHKNLTLLQGLVGLVVSLIVIGGVVYGYVQQTHDNISTLQFAGSMREKRLDKVDTKIEGLEDANKKQDEAYLKAAMEMIRQVTRIETKVDLLLDEKRKH